MQVVCYALSPCTCTPVLRASHQLILSIGEFCCDSAAVSGVFGLRLSYLYINTTENCSKLLKFEKAKSLLGGSSGSTGLPMSKSCAAGCVFLCLTELESAWNRASLCLWLSPVPLQRDCKSAMDFASKKMDVGASPLELDQ